MAKNGHRRTRRSVTYLLDIEKRRKAAKKPLRNISTDELQKNYDELVDKFNELRKFWKTFTIYFEIIRDIDPTITQEDNELSKEFIENEKSCIESYHVIENTITALEGQSFDMKSMKDDTEALGNTMAIFQQLQDSIDLITDSNSKLNGTSEYCSKLYVKYRDTIHEKLDDGYSTIFDKIFKYEKYKDEITVDIDMSKEDEEETPSKVLGVIPSELVNTPSINNVEENNTLEMDYIDPEAFKSVDKSIVENEEYISVTEKEDVDAEEGKEREDNQRS